jgi:hypothetical protein
MIYSFDLYNKVYTDLLTHLPQGNIKRISQLSKLRKLIQTNDLIILFNWGNGARNFQKEIVDNNIQLHTFPNFNTSLLMGDKIKQLTKVNNITKFPLERLYIENSTRELKDYYVPTLENSKNVVVKIGDEHQGESKYLKEPNQLIKTRENIVFEEFIENARSIRVLIFKDRIEDIFIIEHINSDIAKLNKETSWIKNINPIEYVYDYAERYNSNIRNIDDIIQDAILIMKSYNIEYVGVDYVVSENKTGLLEINDMIGLPDDNRVYDRAKLYFRELTSNYLKL